MAKSDPRVPIFVESRISLRQKSKGAIRYSFSSVLSCIAFTFPSDERSLLDDDKSVKKKPFHRFFFPPSLHGDTFLWIWHIEPEPNAENRSCAN